MQSSLKSRPLGTVLPGGVGSSCPCRSPLLLPGLCWLLAFLGFLSLSLLGAALLARCGSGSAYGVWGNWMLARAWVRPLGR